MALPEPKNPDVTLIFRLHSFVTDLLHEQTGNEALMAAEGTVLPYRSVKHGRFGM
jgi:hypothetical protein